MSTVLKAEPEIASSAKRALSQMAGRNIPLHPKNYTVWYEYYQGNNQDLVRDISHLLDLDRPLTNKIHEHLYDKYFANQQSQEVVQRATDEARNILASILDKLLSSANSSADYSKKLNDLSIQLQKTDDLSDVQRLIAEIMEHTETMVGSSRDLQKRLEEESARAENLHTQLEQTKREALTDTLTGLHNRKALDKKIEEMLEAFSKTQVAFSVLMLDVDHFKKVNDQHGHLIGDAVLRVVGKSIANQVKGADFAARYGGEEFAVLLPNTTLDQSVVVAEHIRAAVEEIRLEVVKSNETLPNTTISIGAAQVQQHDSASAVFSRADKALYLAKHTGRNRVKTAT